MDERRQVRRGLFHVERDAVAGRQAAVMLTPASAFPTSAAKPADSLRSEATSCLIRQPGIVRGVADYCVGQRRLTRSAVGAHSHIIAGDTLGEHRDGILPLASEVAWGDGELPATFSSASAAGRSAA